MPKNKTLRNTLKSGADQTTLSLLLFNNILAVFALMSQTANEDGVAVYRVQWMPF